jgi:predicted DCC family thiol-disulfide oxidoreductase YuxK
VPRVNRSGEIIKGLQPIALNIADVAVAIGSHQAFGQCLERRVKLALLADSGDAGCHFPCIGLGGEMITPIPGYRHTLYDLPSLQFFEGIGHIGTRHPQSLSNLLGVERALGDIKQRMDLRDGAIDTPLPAHIAPTQHKALDRKGQRVQANGVCRNFCHDRNNSRQTGFVKRKVPHTIWMKPMTTQNSQEANGPIIVFDGMCVLCSANAQFVLRHDKAQRFRLAAMQGAKGAALLTRFGIDPNDPDTIVIVDGDTVWRDSDAVLEIANGLGWPWRAASLLRVIPRLVRDPIYRFIAANRYRIFGKREACWLPSSDQAKRVL